MTVVLLDPHRPDMIPIRARTHLGGTVYVTEDVPTAVLWALDHVEPAFGDTENTTTLVSTDPHHRLVAARIAAGDTVIAASIPSGSDLLGAVALMDTLRRNGPWESQQTHASLRRYLLEECYELLDAIAGGSQADLREELGDLLLQVLFHARIAADDPTAPFDIDAVARAFTDKVSRRTPGVLSGAHADLDTQIREWEEHKAAEKNRGSVLDGIATSQPALALTQKVLERLAAARYPLSTIDPAVLSVTVAVGDASVEDAARNRTLALMGQVRAAEERAAADGVRLDSPEAWHAMLTPPDVGDPVPAAADTAAQTDEQTDEQTQAPAAPAVEYADADADADAAPPRPGVGSADPRDRDAIIDVEVVEVESVTSVYRGRHA